MSFDSCSSGSFNGFDIIALICRKSLKYTLVTSGISSQELTLLVNSQKKYCLFQKCPHPIVGAQIQVQVFWQPTSAQWQTACYWYVVCAVPAGVLLEVCLSRPRMSRWESAWAECSKYPTSYVQLPPYHHKSKPEKNNTGRHPQWPTCAALKRLTWWDRVWLYP